MRTHTRFTRRIALVAVLALVLALAPAGGLGSASATGSGPGQSNHCPVDSEQFRFDDDDMGPKGGFTVEVVDGKTWTWVYVGDGVVDSIHVFGGKTLVSFDAEGATSGTIDATALDLRNKGGQIADISHVDFCVVAPPEPETYQVIPAKDWVYLLDGVELTGDEIPAGAEAVITIGADEDLVKSWTFDGSGAFVGDDTPLVLPVEATVLYHSEVVTAPEGYTCESDYEEVVVDGLIETVVYTNTCSRTTEETTTTTTQPPPLTVPTLPTEPTAPAGPDEIIVDEPEEAVEGIEEEAPTTVDEAVKGIEEVEALPRTGVDSAATALAAAAALLLGAGLVATTRRRQLTS